MENDIDMNRQFGTVIFFSKTLSFGFILPDGGELGKSDLFFHFSALQMPGYRTTDPNDRVSFDVGTNHKGPCAVNIVIERKA